MIFLKTQSKHCRRFKSPQKKIWLIGKLACGKTNLGGSGPLSILYVSSNWTLDFPATCYLLATRCHFFTRLRPIGNAQRKIWLIAPASTCSNCSTWNRGRPLTWKKQRMWPIYLVLKSILCLSLTSGQWHGKSDRYGRYIFYLNPCCANISIYYHV